MNMSESNHRLADSQSPFTWTQIKRQPWRNPLIRLPIQVKDSKNFGLVLA
jgi:hypothetical protein